ncbi:UNVERIFIED_CONTAM: hypothetical protein Sradi_6162300, partial [Sesamum radiatum]
RPFLTPHLPPRLASPLLPAYYRLRPTARRPPRPGSGRRRWPSEMGDHRRLDWGRPRPESGGGRPIHSSTARWATSPSPDLLSRATARSP